MAEIENRPEVDESKSSKNDEQGALDKMQQDASSSTVVGNPRSGFDNATANSALPSVQIDNSSQKAASDSGKLPEASKALETGKSPEAEKSSDSGNKKYEDSRTWYERMMGNPHVTTDKDGNKITDYGGGRTKFERPDGTGYERTEDPKTGKFSEKHFGPKPENNYSVTGDGKGNKTTDYGNGHIKQENADGTGFERKQDKESGSTTEKHWGPNQKDNYSLTTDKDGNKTFDYGGGRTRVERADGTGYDRQVHEDGTTLEKHFGPSEKDNFTKSTDTAGTTTTDYGNGHRKVENADGTGHESWRNNPDGSIRERHFGPKPENNYEVKTDSQGNKVTKWENGKVLVENKDGTGYERTPRENGAYVERNFGPKPENNYHVVMDENGRKTTFYGNGRTRVESKDGTGYERQQYSDGTYNERRFGPKPGDNYTVSRDKDGNKSIDFGNGHTRREYADGTGYDRYKYDDGSSLEKHFGKKPSDNFTVSTDTEGNKLVDYGNGHTKKINKDGTTIDRMPKEGGGFIETRTGPKPEDNYTVIEDKDGKRLEYRLSENKERELKVQRGEGPYHAAKRYLGPGATHKEVMALVKAMKEEYRKANPGDPHMRGLKQGYQLITNGNFNAIMAHFKDNPEMQKKMMGAARR